MKKLIAFLLSFQIFIFASAQNGDSLQLASEKTGFKISKIFIPAGLQTLGILSLENNQNQKKSNADDGQNSLSGFGNNTEDYAQFAPVAAVYGLELLGMMPKTDWKNRTAILLKGQLLNLGLVYILKKTVNSTRPDGSGLSFPSGHTANAFAGATLLSIEYGERYHWVPYVSYGLASGIGILRLTHEKHYISDVLFGAGLGILSMKIAYWTHAYQWNKRKSTKDPFQDHYPNPVPEP